MDAVPRPAGSPVVLSLSALCLVLAASPALAVPMIGLDLAGQGAQLTVDVTDFSNAAPVGVQVVANDVPAGGGGLFGFGFQLLFPAAGLSASTPAAD